MRVSNGEENEKRGKIERRRGGRQNATIPNFILVYVVEKLLKFQQRIHFNKIFTVSSVKWEIWTKSLEIKKRFGSSDSCGGKWRFWP